MSIANALLAEFDQELETTRRILSRVPEDQLAWRPHEKSQTLGQLALHIATCTGEVMEMARTDVAPMPEDFGGGAPEPANVAEVLTALDTSASTLRERLPGVSDEQMASMWSMRNGDTEIVAMPRGALLRAIMLNHWYHHRRQLSVYLRLLDQSVPSCYGPTADELPDFMAETAAG